MNRPPTRDEILRWRKDPAAYIRERLRADLWSAQEEICRLLTRPPYKVLCKACHKVGKSWLAAALISWHYDCWNPSLTITTGPSKEAVKDQTWRELRILRARAGLGGFKGPAAPELWSSVDHWAKGFTTDKSEGMHGRHQEHMLFLIDEGVGVDAWVYDVLKSQFKPSGKHFWMVIGNPTDTSSQMYAEDLATDLEGNPAWVQVSMSAPDHPNLAAGLRGLPLPFPAAVDLPTFNGWLAEWFDPITADDHASAEEPEIDLEWPPGSGTWYRPGPQGEARALGRWPSAGTFGVWSDSLWRYALRELPLPHINTLPQIGCDVARYGDDYTAIHVRCGPVSLHHERHNGWSTSRTAGRLKELAREYAAWASARRPRQAEPIHYRQIAVKIDDGGVGGGVTDQGEDYDFRPIIAQERAIDELRYPDCRSELWFNVASMARRGQLSLALLPRQTLLRLRQQAMAPVWKQDAAGKRRVESKDEIKKRLNQGSPDDMDSMNLSYYDIEGSGAVIVEPESPRVGGGYFGRS